ncbi:AraC family transcriptional regulator [Enterococcus sp.]|uniref:AraC family transcriptional regulator n=1 Tax=Enterococcus sp. TaxID=35783 RepID=UPI002FCA965A
MEESLFLLKLPNNPHRDCYFSFCGFAKTEPNHSFGPAIRDQYVIHIVLEGKGYYSIKNQKYYLTKGMGFVIPPNISTFYQADEDHPWSYVWMGIGGEMVDGYLESLGLNRESLSFEVRNLNDFKSLVFECFAYEQDDFLNEIILQKQVYKFLERLAKSSISLNNDVVTRKVNPYVNQALEMIMQSEHMNLSVNEIARELAINPSYLSRLFKKDIGSSIKGYMNELRLATANNLLTSTDNSIQKISELTGFSSTQTFSKAFKQSRGISPTIYRQNRIGLGEIRSNHH